MEYPKLKEQRSSRHLVDAFKGYNHNLLIGDGEFFETTNLSCQYYPMLAPRKKRSLIRELTAPQGMLEKDALAYVDNGTLYYNGYATPITGLSTGEKQMVSMGAYILIWPDKVYYNTMAPADYGSMEANWQYTGSVTYEMCGADGVVYENVVSSADEPDDPVEGMYWNDLGNHVLKVRVNAMWSTIETVYTKITFTTQGALPALFKEFDGVDASGLWMDDLNGSKIIYGIGGHASTSNDYIVLVGICSESPHTESSETVRIRRSVPTMNYVCECQNRIWGCYYGNDGTQNLNEIYCCALGDFKNWRQYLGLSTDSYTASCGSDGVWTGCINYLGYPTFFKENVIHRVNVSATGAHQIIEMPARGVQKGSARSLAIIDETLYYKSRTDVCAYQGAFPESISNALGDEKYYNARAGVFGSRYYICMQDESNAWHLFVFDAKKGLWIHEDGLKVNFFTKVDDELYAMTDSSLIGLNGVIGTQEENFRWEGITGIIHYERAASSYSSSMTGIRYISRYDIRAKMPLGSEMDVFIEYDSSGQWEYAGSMKMTATRMVMFPVRPKRCDHLRIKFCGKGDIRLLSIAYNLEKGTDVR